MEEKLLEFKKDGFDIEVHTAFDCDADTSWIGKYTDSLEPGVIVRQYGRYYEDLTEEEIEDIASRGREFRGFKPYAGGEKIGSKDGKEYGLQDYKRMEGLNNGDWCFLGIIATVYKKGIELGSASVWGFESDRNEDDLETEGRSIAEEAIGAAKQNLKSLCCNEK